MGLIILQKRDMCSTFLVGTTKDDFKWGTGHPIVKKIYTPEETSRQSKQHYIC
jgi:hypothetical protein